MTKNRCLAFLLLVFLTGGWGCGDSGGSRTAKESPSRIEEVQGSALSRVILTERAIERLDIQTASVLEQPAPLSLAASNGSAASQRFKVIPYASVIYDASGSTWTYTNPEPQVFLRAGISIAFVEGGLAYLHEGPVPGTQVVTVGAAELFGAELGVGK